MSLIDHLENLDEDMKKAVLEHKKEINRRKLILAVSLIIILVVTAILFLFKLIDKNLLQFIYSAIIGGFIGSSMSFIVNDKQ